MQDVAENDGIDDVLLPGDSLGKKLKGLRRAALSIPNRLRSIAEDARFVQEVAEAYGLPLIANERCGSWYVPPERRAASAYFKSTDGHANQWAISSRRLNLHVLNVVSGHQGCIIVDSTRRGKSMPDALSKTIPIWCAVFNRLIFPEDKGFHRLHTPPNCISASEHQQIEKRLDGFVQQLRSLDLGVAVLRQQLTKPLRPLWVTRESSLPDAPPIYPEFYPIVLCTASRRVAEGDVAADGYVQGAGDDNEGWSRGLTADVFWRNSTRLLETDESQLPGMIDQLLEKTHLTETYSPETLVEPTTWLYVGSLKGNQDHLTQYGLVLHCSTVADEAAQGLLKHRYVHFKCREGKLGSRDLRRQLLKLNGLAFSKEDSKDGYRVLACGEPGSDHAIGVALAVLCLHDAKMTEATLDKNFIRQRLSWISTSLPQARPLRATLQSVNDFLMSGSIGM